MGTQLYTPNPNSIIRNTKVDFTNRLILQKTINLVQYDRGIPIIAVSLYKNGLVYSLPEGMTVRIRWGKRDRTFVYKDALGCNTERNIIFFDVDEQMTYFHGKIYPIIELVDSSGSTPTIAGSSSIPVVIERNPIQESDIQSASEYLDLTGGNYIEINYDDLVTLRDSNSLKKGAFYRITDYETTTVQEETRSAGHLFDIIVQALDEETLSENASAINRKKESLPWFEHNQSDFPETFFYVDSVVIDGLTLYRWISYEELHSNSQQYLLTETKNVGVGDVVWGYQMIDSDWHEELLSNYEDDILRTKTIINVGEGYNTLSWFEHNQSDLVERYFYVDSVVIDGLTLYRWLSEDEFDNGTDAEDEFDNGTDAQYLLTETKNVGIGDIVWGYQMIDDNYYAKDNEYEDDEFEPRIINNVGVKYITNPIQSDYFDGMRLEAWKLKYTLDNDRLKYYWADPVNGKGVIYRMIDEYENDLPYDFKNIQFKRYYITESFINPNLGDKYYALKNNNGYVYPEGAVIYEDDFIWAYTFTTKVIDDGSYVESTTLNKYIGINDEARSPYCAKNIFGGFNEYLNDDLLGFDEFNSFLLGNNVIYSEIDLIDEKNPIYLYLPNSNTIGNRFIYNTIGESFMNNTIGNGFIYNTIENYFINNNIGNGFGYNSIGNSFEYNTIGNSFYGNNVWDLFINNTIGNDFGYNTVGNSFQYSTVENGVKYIKFPLIQTYDNTIRYLHLKNGLKGASSSNRLDLYYDGLYGRLYPTTFEIIANDNIVSSWEATPLTRAGKVKATKTTSTWSNTI